MARKPQATNAEQARVTRLLERLEVGEDDAFNELFPLVYAELHGLARIQRRRWDGSETLNTTSLLHEAYLKLVEQDAPSWKDRSHFLAVASRAMRHILIDYAKRQGRLKRGAGYRHFSFEEVRDALRDAPGLTDERLGGLVALDASLDRLAAVHPRQSRIVECRVFGGMTIKDTAEVLRVSPATIKRGWAVALAWLHRDLKESAAIEGRSPLHSTGTAPHDD